MRFVQPVVTVTGYESNGLLRCELPREMVARRLLRIFIRGPKGSMCAVYLNFVNVSTVLDQAGRGDINTAEYSARPVMVPAWETVILDWDSPNLAGQVAIATFHVEAANGLG